MTYGRTGHTAWQLYSTEPRIALLHGFADSADCWRPLVPALSAHGGVLAVDARGHGRSTLPDGPVGPVPQAADVAAVLDNVVRPQPVVVIGHSMGAITAAALAASRPDLVAALILEDPPPRLRASGLPAWLAKARALPLEDCVAHARAANPTWPEDELPMWAQSKHDFDPRYCDRPAAQRPTLLELVGRITCPTLLLRGEPELGGLVDDATAADLVASAGGPLQDVRVDGVGHNIRREARAEYLRQVLTHITRLELG